NDRNSGWQGEDNAATPAKDDLESEEQHIASAGSRSIKLGRLLAGKRRVNEEEKEKEAQK
ncbi:hypothetical protein ACC848_44620, partial [Rhizobium johnstonii]